MFHRTALCLFLLAVPAGCLTSESPDELSRGGHTGPGTVTNPGSTTVPPGVTPDDGPGNTWPSAGLQPLPANSFPFVRAFLRQDIKEWTAQIWAFDLDTKTERLITRFDDGLKWTSLIGRVALSPDRRWAAFSGFYKPPTQNSSDVIRLIWKVSVDGARFVRVTPPFDPRDSCGPTSPCKGLAEQICEQGRCTPYAWSFGYENPMWSPDGKLILFHWAQAYCYQHLCTTNYIPAAWNITYGVATIEDRPGAEAIFRRGEFFSKCNTGEPQMSPDGRRLAFLYNCGGADGILLSDPDGANLVRLPKDAVHSFRWNAKGTGVYYLNRNRRDIAFVDLQSNAETHTASINEPFSIQEFIVSPDGRLIVTGEHRQTKASDLYLVDPIDPTVGERLTRDGASRL